MNCALSTSVSEKETLRSQTVNWQFCRVGYKEGDLRGAVRSRVEKQTGGSVKKRHPSYIYVGNLDRDNPDGCV